MGTPQGRLGTGRDPDPGSGEVVYAPCSERTLIAALRELLGPDRIRLGRSVDLTSTRMDTQDERLARRGAQLVEEVDARGGRCLLTEADGRTWRWPGARSFEFAQELPAGAARAALEALAGEGRLLATERRTLRRRLVRVLDAEGKTVVRIEFERTLGPQATTGGERDDRRALLRPVRGYRSKLAELVARLERHPQLARAGRSPRARAGAQQDASSKAAAREIEWPELEPGISAEQGVRRILRYRLAQLQKQEPGVRQGLDSKSLHDFRLALRRTRCVLGELGRVLPAEQVEALRDELRWLGQMTGPVRDLDVLLETTREAPGVEAADLEPLLARLEGRRRDGQMALAHALESPRYAALLAAWRDLSAPLDLPAWRVKTLRRLLAKRLGKRVPRLRRGLARDAAGRSAAELHKLRIEGKKLRYVLECCRGSVPDEHLEEALRVLKQLQDRLGALNDASVHNRLLSGYALELGPLGDASEMLTLGRLVEQTAARESAQREGLPEAFASFRGRKTSKVLERLVDDLETQT